MRKLDHYEELLREFSSAIQNPSQRNLRKFSEAYTKVSAYASTDVLQACHKFLHHLRYQDEFNKENPQEGAWLKKQDELISDIFEEIHLDVNGEKLPYRFYPFVAPLPSDIEQDDTKGRQIFIQEQIDEASTFLKNGNFEMAIKSLETAIKYEPKNYTIWMLKGVVYDSAKDYKNSLLCLQEAEKLNPEDKEIKQMIENVRKKME